MTITFVVPPETVPSGGHTYDRRMAGALSALGRPVRTMVVAGEWPRPEGTDSAETGRAGLGRVLSGLPDGTITVMDGLVACGSPEVLEPHAWRLRLVVLVHLPLADEAGLDAATARELDSRERAALGTARAVVATGQWAARRLARHHGLARVHTVAPGTDPAPLSPGTDGARRLLCVASVTPRKGHDLLLRALAHLADLSWECVCVGPFAATSGEAGADHLANAWALARARGVAERVEFTGERTGAELESAYGSADLLVLPSRAETYGMVVTEALARGVPVVAASVGGVPEALGRDRQGEQPGLLVAPEDAGALADALRRWLTEPDLRDRARASARRRRTGLAGWTRAARTMATVLDREVGT